VAEQIIVRTYKGSESGTSKAFQKDAARLAPQGYLPVAQSWAKARGNTDLVLWHGLLSTFYVLRSFMKPAGTLTVTYEYHPSNDQRGGSQVEA
jgi:hypothetical protein